MAADFGAALATIERMKLDGVITDYAIGGAMALVFWTEPVPTFDLDVFVFLPAQSELLLEEAVVDRRRLERILQTYNLRLPS